MFVGGFGGFFIFFTIANLIFLLLGFDVKIQGIFIASGFSGDHSRSMTGNGKGFWVHVYSFIVG